MAEWIGTDLDNTLCDSYSLIKKSWETVLKKTLSSNDLPSASDMLHLLSAEERRTFFKVFNKSFHQCEFFKDAVSALWHLKEKGFKVGIVTSRGTPIAKETIRYLNYNQIPYDRLFLGDNLDKRKIAKEMQFYFMVEDDFPMAKQVAQYCKTYLIDYPWNRSFKEDNVIRVSGWDKIMEHEDGRKRP